MISSSMKLIPWGTSLIVQWLKFKGPRFDPWTGRPGFDPCVGKTPWRRECYPLQYSGLENSVDCIVHGIAKSQTQLSDFHFFTFGELDPTCATKDPVCQN